MAGSCYGKKDKSDVYNEFPTSCVACDGKSNLVEPDVELIRIRRLVLHAATCTGGDECINVKNCTRMKRLIKHMSDCGIKDCEHCQAAAQHLQSHYARCSAMRDCPVYMCDEMRGQARSKAEAETLLRDKRDARRRSGFEEEADE